MELAAHAESAGADCIAAIPPIYFHLPDRAVAKYWTDIASAAPNTDFIIYNIPQLAGTALNSALLRTMLAVPTVIGVKNSSMPIQDIEMWRDEGAIVFNGRMNSSSLGACRGRGRRHRRYVRRHAGALRAHLHSCPRRGHHPRARHSGRLLPYHLQDVLRAGQHVRHDKDPPSPRRAGYRRRPRAALSRSSRATGPSPRALRISTPR